MDDTHTDDEIPIKERIAALRAEIRRLEGIVAALEEEERNNTPHKQLTLF